MSNRIALSLFVVALGGVFVTIRAAAQLQNPKIADARKDENGFLCHTVESELQKAKTEIKVLLPDRLEKDRRYPVVYVLPVEAKNGAQFGNGLLEIKKHDLHNKQIGRA